jgi:hypothetical protein
MASSSATSAWRSPGPWRLLSERPAGFARGGGGCRRRPPPSVSPEYPVDELLVLDERLFAADSPGAHYRDRNACQAVALDQDGGSPVADDREGEKPVQAAVGRSPPCMLGGLAR